MRKQLNQTETTTLWKKQKPQHYGNSASPSVSKKYSQLLLCFRKVFTQILAAI
jgi:hypothetical protein